MAVAYRSAGAVCSRSGSTSATVTVTQPAGHQAGDILILTASSGASGGVTISTPAGWTLISQSATWNGGFSKSAVFYKVAASSSEPSVSVTTAGTSYLDCQITAWSGADGTTPIDANTGWSASGAGSTNFLCQAITTVANNALIVYLIHDVDGTAYTTPPGGATENSELASGATGWHHVVASKIKTPAGAESSGNYTKAAAGASGGDGIVIALKPFVAAVTPAADFTGTPLSGVWPLSVAFTDASTNTPTSWAWTFGDGGTSSSQNPTHSYAAGGTYTVVLVATNAGGSDTKTRTGYVTVANPSGTFTKIKWGSRLVVTDEGGGVIRVDFV